jgi:nucleotide-binding universal stress UspA family protein
VGEFTDERLVDFLLGLRSDPELEDAVRAEPNLRRRCETLRVDLRSFDREFAQLLKDATSEPLSRPCLRILLAVSDSPSSRRATLAAIALALRAGGDVEVLHVRIREVNPCQPMVFESSVEAAAIVERALNEALARGAAAHGRLLCSPPDKVAHNIVWEAEDTDADLIVIGSEAHTWAQRMLRPRVSSRVVKMAQCPVLVTR